MPPFAQPINSLPSQARIEPSQASGSADVFAIATTAGLPERSKNPFPGTQRVTIPPRRSFVPTLQVFAGASQRVLEYYDDSTETAIYLWGRATHATLSDDDLLLHMANIARSPESERLRDVLGNFVCVLDDRHQRRIIFISDALGLRPWFVGSHRGQLVAGSNVLGICAAGLTNGEVDYDAVSCWLKYNHDCTGGSVVTDYKHIQPGVVSTFDATGKLIRQTEYGRFEFADAFLPPDEMADRIHSAAAHSFAVQTRDLADVNMPLSGGYDSRLLLALGCETGLRMHAQTVNTREYEVALAIEVAAALKHPLKIVHSRRRILDLFDDPFAFSPAGFPTGRNLTSALARRHPGMPLVSGFLGDGVMRGSMTVGGTARWAKDRAGLSADQLTHGVHHDYEMYLNRFHLLRPRVAKQVEQRAMQCLHRVIQRGIVAGKPILHADLFARHRCYFANIFLQHLDVAEAILPYHTWELINLRTSYDQRCYTGRNYPTIFERHHPAIANIKHTIDFVPPSDAQPRAKVHATRHLRRFAADVAAALVLTDCLDGARRNRILSLLPGALLGEPRFQEEVQFAYKLQLFERKLRRYGIRMDWDAI